MDSTALALAGRYRLEQRIAAGGVGEVWRGRDTVLARAVAVKLLRPEYAQHPETLDRFRAEARHAAGVTHPGIAQVYDYGEDGQPFLVMELIDGPSLASVLTAGPLDAVRTMDVAAQTASALAAAHAAGLVHRDIKPGNLLIAPGDQVKITDFGIAHAAGSAPLTRTGTVIGTPAYLAPERIAGRPGTAGSDLYSLGIVCYECLTGAPPFSGTSVEVALAHRHGEVPDLPPAVPAEVAALIVSLTAKDPAARPASAAGVAQQATRLRDALYADAGHGDLAGGQQAPGATAPDLGWAEPGAATNGAAINGTVTQGLQVPRPESHGPATARLTAAPSDPDSDATAPWSSHRASPARGRALALAGIAAIVIGLAGWLLANALGSAAPAAPKTGPAPVSTSSPAPRMVTVNQASLIGQPVSVVRQQLRQDGLVVHVSWQRDGHQQPGTVVAVRPSGQLRVGATVLLTGALSSGHGHGHGHGHGDGGGGDQGNGGGQGD